MAHISKGTPNAWGRDEGASSWLSQLNYATLRRCREIVKKVFMQGWTTEFITDREADRIIEAMGPETMDNLQEKAADKQRLESVRKKIDGESQSVYTGPTRPRIVRRPKKILLARTIDRLIKNPD